MARTNHRQILLKRNNQAQILLGVRKYGSISRAQLTKATGLSISCVCNIVSELLAEGTLIESGTLTGQRGGPMALLDINPDGAPVAGIWFTYEEIHTVVADAAGKILARRNVVFDYANSSPDAVIRAMAAEVEKCAEAASKDVKTLRGVGLSVGGTVDPVLGVIITEYEEYNQLDGVPVVRMLSEELGVPVYAENDVHAAAFTEAWFSSEVSGDGTVYLTVGKGTGCSYVHNNDVVRGAHGMSGRFCDMIIEYGAPNQGKINMGAVNSLVADFAFIGAIWPDLAQAARYMSADESTELVKKGVNMALDGDQKAYSALLKITKCLGVAVANIVSFVDPRTVFIGGTLVDLIPDFTLDNVRAEALQHLTARARAVQIRPLMNYREFILRGSIGLVFGQEYRVLRDDIMRARTV